ncbi:MAG: putative toxin of system [Pseudomonadota bacterium]
MNSTLDTGALIALERGSRRLRELVARTNADGGVVTIPCVVLTEWWRAGMSDKRRREILEPCVLEQTLPRVYMLAGEALGIVDGSTAIDAIVMASAAQRGDVVYTSDYDDLERLRTGFFGAVPRILRAG